MDFATKFGADPVTEAFWSAVSVDAIQAQQGETASFIADSPLWFHDQPEQLKDLWKDMKSTLLAAGQDWQVWTTWYDDRLDGHVREEERELTYVRIESEIWNQGPAIVNAEIKRQIEGPWLIQETAEAQDSVTAEVIRGIEEIKPHGPLVGLSADMTSRAGGSMRPHGPAVVEQPQLVPPEPPLEPGPLLRVTERGLEIIPQPMGEDFDEDLQKALHGRLQRLLPTLEEVTHRAANAHPVLDLVISEYSDLIAVPFDQLDIASLWSVGTGLLAFREAFTNQARGTITEPLEPSHLALLQQTAEIHGEFILGFPKGRELTDRADHAQLSPEIIARITPPAHNILAGLASASNFVELRTRKFLHVADASFLAHGWQAARIGHATYVIIRNSVIALGKFLFATSIACAGLLGEPILPALNLDAHTKQVILEFLVHNAQDVLSFVEPFPELRNWIAFLIDHLDRE